MLRNKFSWLRVAALILLFLGPAARAQSPLWSGNYVPGHAVQQAVAGVLSDAGSALGSSQRGVGYITELGITNAGTPFCINDALINAPGGYHQFCLGANALGGGLIAYNAYGGALSLPLNFVVNGVTYAFPFTTGGNVVGPATSVVNDTACWNNTSGTLLKDCGGGLMVFRPETYGAVADAYCPVMMVSGGCIGLTFAANSPAVGGVTFPAGLVGKPITIFGGTSTGGTFNTTVLSPTTLAASPTNTVSSYKAVQGFVASALSNNNAPNDLLTLSDSRATCATAPVFQIQWISGTDISLSVQTAGACTVLPPNPFQVTSNGLGTGITVNGVWGNSAYYLSGALVGAAGSGYSASDSLGISGVTCSVQPVLHPVVDGSGHITNLSVATPGVCSVAVPTLPDVALTGGSGTGGFVYADMLPAGMFAVGTDNVSAFAAMASAVQAAGGGTINLSGGNYGVFTSTPSSNYGPVLNFNGIDNIWVQGNGSQIIDGHHFVTGPSAANDYFLLGLNIKSIRLWDYSVVQAEPSNHAEIGIYGAALGTGVNNLDASHVICRGGELTIGFTEDQAGSSPASGIWISGGGSYGCTYGLTFANSGDNATVRSFECFQVGRCYFPYGVFNHDVSITTQNDWIDDVLLRASYHGFPQPLQNVRLNYKYRARLAGEPSADGWIDFQAGGTGFLYSNIKVNVDIDARGETGFQTTAIRCTKDSPSFSGTWRGITIGGAIYNIQNLAGALVDCPAQGTTWSSDTFNSFKFDQLVTSGSATPTEYSDLSGFSGAPGTTMGIADSNVVGAWTFANKPLNSLSIRNSLINGGFYYTNCTTLGGSSLNPSVQTAQAANTTEYYGPSGFSASGGTSNTVSIPNAAGVLTSLLVNLDTAPGGALTDTAALNINGTDQIITCSITGSATSCSDALHFVSNNGTGKMSLKFNIPATAASTGVNWSVQYCTP